MMLRRHPVGLWAIVVISVFSVCVPMVWASPATRVSQQTIPITSTPTSTATPTSTPTPTIKIFAGEVFLDHNRNGIREQTESGVKNITVVLQNFSEGTVESERETVTDVAGIFLFSNVTVGSRVGFRPPPGYGTSEIDWRYVLNDGIFISLPYTPVQATATSTITPTLPPTVTPTPTNSSTPEPMTQSALQAGRVVYRPKGDLGVVIQGHASAPLDDGRILITGGFTGRDSLSSAWLLDPVQNQMVELLPMSATRSGHTATSLQDGRVLVVGPNDSQIFDPNTNSWTAPVLLNETRSGHTATLLPNGDVLVVGSCLNNDLNRVSRTAELYSPTENVWRSTPQLNYGRRCRHKSTLMENGNVLVTGGFRYEGPIPEVEIYNITTNEWISVANMNQPREWHTATLLEDGAILVAGGNMLSPTNTAEIYDPNSDIWLYTGNLTKEIFRATSQRLLDGSVLVFFGETRNVWNVPNIANADLYDLRTGKWSDVGYVSRFAEYHPTSSWLLSEDSALLILSKGEWGILTYYPHLIHIPLVSK